MIFKSAGGRRSIYRVQLKKAILENMNGLKDMKKPESNSVVASLILDVLDESKEGLIPKMEFKEAVKKVVLENEVEMDDKTLTKLIDEIYKDGNGIKQSKISR